METGKPLPDEKARTLTPGELTLHQEARDRVHEWFTKGRQHLTKNQAKNTMLLLDASMVGDIEAARVLLEKGVRVLIEDQSEDGVKRTALHYAAAGGHTDVVWYVIVEINDILNSKPLTLNPCSTFTL